MATGTRRGSRPQWDVSTTVAAGILVVVLPIGVLVWGAVAAAGGDSSGGPIGTLLRLATGKTVWPGTAATLALVGEVAALAAVAAAGWWGWRRLRGRRSRVDAAAAVMGRGQQIAALAPAAAAAKAQRLAGVVATDDPATHGPLIGYTVAGNTPLRSSWEDTTCVIAGPRRMKTSTQVIPELCDAPGPAIATSNKRDVVDAVRGPRSTPVDGIQRRVWVFDPQGLVDEPPAWWWDPLSQVRSVTAAQQLAGHFAAGSSRSGTKNVQEGDSYWEDEAEALLANLLLAAAASGQSILQVYTWLTRPTDRGPVTCLERAGHALAAQAVNSMIESPDKQRGSVYTTARKMTNCLIEPAVTRWVTPGGSRPLFVPETFVTSRDTLLAVSREGQMSATPLVTALIAAVLETAERVAARSPDGRLPVPLVASLDEVANVCRIRELPNLYSHYGSRGIVLKSLLQGWPQGVTAWGQTGMKQLWDSSTIRIYGGGVADREFLEMLSQMIGEVDVDQWSTSWSQGRSTVQQGTRRLRVLDVAELAALPAGRAIVLPAGMPPILVRTRSWHDGPWAAQIEASRDTYDPGRRNR